jgi:DMSO/TMAO reductase YedYZ molybdopterin-dependent catalytic subunit
VAAVSHRARDALAGAVAAGVALGIGELVTGFDRASSSLVVAVGDEFVDRFAASLKDVAIRLFGTNDKVALVTGIVVVSLGLGAMLGLVARRRRWAGPVVFAAFALVGLVAYHRAPLTSTGLGIAAALAAGIAGAVSLELLLRRPAGVAEAAGPGPRIGGAPRRDFLLTAGTLSVGAAVSAALGRRLRATDPGADVRANTVLPRPVDSTAVPSTQPFAEPGLTPYITPTADFYRIDTALTVPRVDPADWHLEVDGLVERPFSLTFDQLLALDAVAEPVTMQCVSNEVGGDLIGTAVWQGVPLAALLDRAGVRPDGTQVVGRSVDGWTAGFPTELAGDGRTAMVAYAMNGELLPPRHGFPARLLVAGLYGYVSATKWLDRIELTRLEDVDGYWISRGWSKDGPIKLASRIDVPRRGAAVGAGPTAIAGVAWAPTRGISAVEVQVDDGPWQRCALGDAASDETWVQWHLRWDAMPGRHVVRVRAVDGGGETQTDEVSDPAPDGATGLHARRVDVT